MKNKIKLILQHLSFYLISCFVGVLQLFLLISLTRDPFEIFTKPFYQMAFLITAITAIISFPAYFICIMIISYKKITAAKYYVIGGMLTACSWGLVGIFFREGEALSSLIFPIFVTTIFGIIPGILYYHLNKKFCI